MRARAAVRVVSWIERKTNASVKPRVNTKVERGAGDHSPSKTHWGPLDRRCRRCCIRQLGQTSQSGPEVPRGLEEQRVSAHAVWPERHVGIVRTVGIEVDGAASLRTALVVGYRHGQVEAIDERD